jgi:hypothetical protein
MIDIGLASLLMLGFAGAVADPTGEAIADDIRAVLGRRGGSYPYFAEYQMGLPVQPRPSGGNETRRYFAEAADRLYLEEARETYSLKVLVGPKTQFFAYDEQIGHALCTGPANLAGTDPERWLLAHGFPIITLAAFDADLVGYLRQLLTGSTILRQEEASDLRTYHLSSRIGPLAVVLGPARVEVSRPAEGGAAPKTLFRYAHRVGKPPWIGVVAELTARFDDPKAEVHRVAAEFTMAEALKAAAPEFDNTSVVLDTAALGRVVRRHSYLVPDPAVVKVVEATTRAAELHFKIESGGSTYYVSQYPGSRFADVESYVRSLQPRARRKLGDYVVLDIAYPNVVTNHLYFIKSNATLIVSDPDRRKLDFEDPTPDRLIQSFAATKP